MTSLPGFVNAHVHSSFGPQCCGVTRSRPFEAWMVDIMGRQNGRHTPEEAHACALLTGLQNLAAGNTALIDQCSLPQTKEHVYAVAQAYENLGLRAWVFINVSDLPSVVYTREAYPNYPKAIPFKALPVPLKALSQITATFQEQLDQAVDIVQGWSGQRVQVGVSLTNPVWCSDELLKGTIALTNQLGLPITVHAEESPVQREAHLAQWGMSGTQRLAQLGVLTPRTLVAHAVQVDDDDIALLAAHRCSVVHNPLSNLKLRNGIAPIGKMLTAGINVCLGTDGHSSGDSQSLFAALKIVAALADLNGIRDLGEEVEEIALRLAVDNGRRLWFSGDLGRDYMEFSEPIGPYGYVWDDPATKIAEVYVDSIPRLAQARRLIQEGGVASTINLMMKRMVTPEREARVEQLVRFVTRSGGSC